MKMFRNLRSIPLIHLHSFSSYFRGTVCGFRGNCVRSARHNGLDHLNVARTVTFESSVNPRKQTDLPSCVFPETHESGEPCGWKYCHDGAPR